MLAVWIVRGNLLSSLIKPSTNLNKLMSTENKPIIIREMELEDLAPVFALGEQVFTADKWPSLYRTWDVYEPVRFFSSDGEFCFVAERDGNLLGFALGNFIEKRKSAWSYGYLVWIAVQPKLKRTGVASRLTDAVTHAFIREGARMMIVDTDAQNKTAIKFFKRHGFGNEDKHVFLSKNLTTHPDYQKLRGSDD